MSIVRKPSPWQVLHRPALDVETELPRVVVPQLRLVGGGEGLADLIEHFEIGHRVRPGRPCQGRLVQEDGIGEFLDAGQVVVEGGGGRLAGDPMPKGRIQRLLDQRALAGPLTPVTTQTTPSGKARRSI